MEAIKERESLGHSYFDWFGKYFTFFSDFGRKDSVLPWVEAGVAVMLSIIAILGNTAILISVTRKRQKNKPTVHFIGNLALSDITFALAAPLIAVTRVTHGWVLGGFLCHTIMYLHCVCGTVSIWTMTIISIHRYCRIIRHHTKPLSTLHAKFICFLVWLTSLAAFLPVAVYFDTRRVNINDTEANICTLLWPDTSFDKELLFATAMFLLGFVFPLLIMGFNYFWIFRKFWKSRNAVRSHENFTNQRQWVEDMNQRVASNSAGRLRRRDERDFRVVRILLLLVGLFVAMWFPVFICFFFIEQDGSLHKMRMHSQYFFAATCLIYANAGINPVLYGLINNTLVIEVCKCGKCCAQRNRQDQTTVFVIGRAQNQGSDIQIQSV